MIVEKLLDTLTAEGIASHRVEMETKQAERLLFRVAGLYGVSDSVRFPLNETESFDTGSICLTIDPEVEDSCNIGIVDYTQSKLHVRYGAHFVFPGLYDLVVAGNFDPSLLNPVRVTATDECTLQPDLSGWQAYGCLEFLPGSVWSGAAGG